MSARAQPRTGFGKDSLEIESYVRGLARRRPDVVVTTLRLANLMGAGVDSHVTRYLSLPVVPRVMGFDARLQFLHPSDAVAALLLATRRDVPGTFNVASADIVTLSQALRKMGRPSVLVPHPAAPLVATLVRQARLVDFSTDQIDALTYGRAMDTSRFTAETGFVPQFSSLAALAEFVSAAKPGWLSPERVDGALAAVSRLLRSATVRSG
jgi:UDP-glucose 4-epimerase